jgi:hypothetical protein
MVRCQQVVVPNFTLSNRRLLDVVLLNTVRPAQEYWRKPATPYPSRNSAALYGNGCQCASKSFWQNRST